MALRPAPRVPRVLRATSILSAFVSLLFFACAAPDNKGPDSSLSRRGDLDVRVDRVQSDSVTLSWPAFEDSRGVRILFGADPSTASDGELGGATVLLEADATATSYTVSNLAAGTHVFLRVELDTTDSIKHWGNVHVELPGGPSATLTTPLREVHALGPNVLMLVLSDSRAYYVEDSGSFESDHGAEWQAGDWVVSRADGTAVTVEQVFRRSEAIGQPDYPVGYDQYGDGKFVDIDHSIFLVLQEAMGSNDVLTVAHTGSSATELSVRIPFSDHYLETPLLQVNQVGYSPQATRRWAYVSGYMGDGGGSDLTVLPAQAEVLVESPDPLDPRAVVLSNLAVTTRVSDDEESGTEVSEIDLALLPASETARYRVRLPGIGVSWRTAVSDRAGMRSFYSAARGLYHNRWCGDLDPRFTEWSRPADHCEAYFVTGTAVGSVEFFPQSTSLADRRPLVGGHHDAGDFDIRPYHVLVAQYLLRAYEISPSRFSDGQLTLPESGNEIPDLLDEALWSVAGWQALQNEDGSVRAGVESWRHPAGIYFANEDELPYWTYDPLPWHTAYTAALFAQSARLVRPYNSERASVLEDAARKAYAASITRSAPEAYQLYAASELFALTAEAPFKADFERLWQNIDRYGRGAFDNVNTMPTIYPGAFTGYAPAMADFVMGYVTAAGANAEIVAITREQVEMRADAATAALLESPHAHRNGREPGSPHGWGRTVATGGQVDMIYQALQLGGYSEGKMQRYIDALSVAADYLLGCNPVGATYVTGLGSRSPRQPLHLDSLAGQKERGMPPIPGITVYGPVEELPHEYYYDPIRFSQYPDFDALPPGRRYADTRNAVTTNEFTVWETSTSTVELFSALLGPAMMPPSSWLPGGSEHQSQLP